MNGDQLLAGAAALAHLDEHVGPACNDLCLRVLKTELYGLLDTVRLIERFHIIHGALPP